METIGTRAHPAFAKVQTEQRALELVAFCQEGRLQAIVELAPDEPEDIADIERALRQRQPATASPRVGRNECCPCGSGRKFKKCCEGQPSLSA